MSHRYSPLTITVLLLVFASPHRCWGQDQLVTQGSIGAAVVVPIESFSTFGGMSAPDSIDYTNNGTSVQPWIVLGADMLFANRLRIGLSLGYRQYGMDFSASESAPIATADGGITTALFSHSLSTTFTGLSLEPYLRFEPIARLGLSVGFPVSGVVKTDYTQTVQITDPDSLTFVDGSKSQLTGNGVIETSSVIVPGVGLKADYMISLNTNNSIYLTPSVGMLYQLGSWSSESSLRSFSFEFGIGVRVEPLKEEVYDLRVRDTTYTRDTVVLLSAEVSVPTTELVNIEVEEFADRDTIRVIVHQRYHLVLPRPPEVLRASIALAFETENGSLSPEARLRLDKIHRTRIVPILPVVIFDKASELIPDRYVKLTEVEARHWNERRVFADSKVHWQYHLLNIVGSRMRDSASTALNLICFDDGTDSGRATSGARLNTIKEYICNIFNIDRTRVRTENRRGQAAQQPWVFLQDTTRRLLQPVTVSDTTNEMTLPRVRIEPEVVSGAGVRSWEVEMVQHDSVVRTMSGKGEIPAGLVWDMNLDVDEDDVFSYPLSVIMKVEDRDGARTQSAPSQITLLGPTATEMPDITGQRNVVLRWIGADYLHTPDIELFGLNPVFTRIDVYPSFSRHDDFFVVNAPAVVHPIGANAWFRDALLFPERELYQHAEVYTYEKRRP